MWDTLPLASLVDAAVFSVVAGRRSLTPRSTDQCARGSVWRPLRRSTWATAGATSSRGRPPWGSVPSGWWPRTVPTRCLRRRSGRVGPAHREPRGTDVRNARSRTMGEVAVSSDVVCRNGPMSIGSGSDRGERMASKLKARDVPGRVSAGAYILHAGLQKWDADEGRATAVHGMAAGAFPVLRDIPPERFVRMLALGEIGTGVALLTPFVSTATAGAASSPPSPGPCWRCTGEHPPCANRGASGPAQRGPRSARTYGCSGSGWGSWSTRRGAGAAEVPGRPSRRRGARRSRRAGTVLGVGVLQAG